MAHVPEKHPCQPVRCTVNEEVAMTVSGIARRRVYLAHSMLDYGEPSKRERNWVKAFYGDHNVWDPEELPWSELRNALGSNDDVYEYVISRVEEVVVIEHNSFVGRGVFMEVRNALQVFKPVWVLRGMAFIRVVDIRYVDIADWQYRYGRLLTTHEE